MHLQARSAHQPARDGLGNDVGIFQATHSIPRPELDDHATLGRETTPAKAS
jgi:hypothetical protein